MIYGKGFRIVDYHRCWICKTAVIITDFVVRKNGTISSSCKSCSQSYFKTYKDTEAGKASIIKSSRKRHRTIRGRFNSAKGAAKSRNIPFHLTLAEFEKIIADAKCSYCRGQLFETGSGLDRMDSNHGYTLDNVVPCCGVCNRIKMAEFSYLEMKQLGKTLSRIFKARTK